MVRVNIVLAGYFAEQPDPGSIHQRNVYGPDQRFDDTGQMFFGNGVGVDVDMFYGRNLSSTLKRK